MMASTTHLIVIDWMMKGRCCCCFIAFLFAFRFDIKRLLEDGKVVVIMEHSAFLQGKLSFCKARSTIASSTRSCDAIFVAFVLLYG